MGRRFPFGVGGDPYPKSQIVIFLALVLVGLFGLGACALILTSGAAGTAAGAKYSVDNVAHKTFNVDLLRLKEAAREALIALDLESSGPFNTKEGARIVATTEKLNIDIVFQRVSTRATRMSVNAKAGFFKKDRATADEIIRQTNIYLGNESHLVRP